MAKAQSGGASHTPEPVTDLPALVARLGDGILELLDGKITLLKLDLEETVRGYRRDALGLGLAAATVAIGAALIACGLAFVLAYLLPADLDPLLARALAFGAVGTLATIGGVAVLRRHAVPQAGRHD